MENGNSKIVTDTSRPLSFAPRPFQEERIIFMGTPAFAVASLAALVDSGCNVVAVITAPDRPSGRGMKLQPSAVKEYAESRSIPVLQPTNLKSQDFLQKLQSYQATLQVVVAFRMLPEVVWVMPPKGTFNLHASLLPQYRGAAPINHAIINGELDTGVTTFFLQHQIDTGNIILQQRTPIGPSETAGALHDRLMTIGACLVVETVQQIAQGTVTTRPQIVTPVLHEAPKIFKEHCRIDWNRSVSDVFNLVRGLSPYPSAFTMLVKDGEEVGLKVLRAELANEPNDARPGAIKTDGQTQLYVGCADGWLSLLEVQLAGKRSMPIGEFLKGFNAANTRILD